MNSSPSPSPFLSPSLSPYPPPFYLLKPHHPPIATDAAIAASSLALFVLLLFLFISCYKKHTTNTHHLPIIADDHTIAILRHAASHPLTEVDTATDGFHPSLIIGTGPLGTVYHAVTPSGDPLAVKRIHPGLILFNAAAALDFSSRLRPALSLNSHPNLVPVLGFSEAPGERILITGLVATATNLDSYLHDAHVKEEPNGRLGWKARLSIAAGAARGIEHLHDSSPPGIVHGRVKPSNILIDYDDDKILSTARVCDYGLSFLDPGSYKRGMVGYMDGEGKEEVSKANDVYGLGVILLEILSGRRCEGGLLVDWALPLIRMGRVEEVLDGRVGLPEGVVLGLVVRMAKVALACVGNGRKSRPSIGQVAAILGCLEREVNWDHGRRRRRAGRREMV